ncbi:hypothetical protein NNL21_00850 [Paenibacillus mendelii]|nr:hypothetical protein [Paenibacillus mendelii]
MSWKGRDYTMPLQTQNLIMQGLGVNDDVPGTDLQPPLPDGVHLRWGFRREKGFPWPGFYLFRRMRREIERGCLGSSFGQFESNVLVEWDIGSGKLSSDVPLESVDNFSPAGRKDVSLASGSYLRFALPPGKPARWIEASVGFMSDGEVEVRLLSGEAELDLAVLKGKKGEIRKAQFEFDWITGLSFSKGAAVLIDICVSPAALDAFYGWESIKDCPYPITLPVYHPDYRPTMGMAPNLEKARSLARSRISYGDPDRLTGPLIPPYSAGLVQLTPGSAIVRGSGTGWTDKMIGSVIRLKGDSNSYGIVDVFGRDRLVMECAYNGPAIGMKTYEILEDSFAQLHNQLLRLVEGGLLAEPMYKRYLPKSAYQSGTVTVAKGSVTVTGAGTQWTTDMEGLEMRLMFKNTGTASVNKGSDLVIGFGTTWQTGLVGQVIFLPGDTRSYAIERVDSPTQLKLVESYQGTGGTLLPYLLEERHAYRITGVKSAAIIELDRPYAGNNLSGRPYAILPVGKPRQYPLDLALLASLDPAAAQALGLYWIDRTAVPGVSYDYLIVTAFQGKEILTGEQMLKQIQTDKFATLDGFIAFNLKMEQAAPLAEPQDVRVYSLPVTTMRRRDGSLAEACGNAGIRWKIQSADKPWLPFREPVMYHLWRAELGEGTPAMEPDGNIFKPITQDFPVIVPRALLSAGLVPDRPADWPPFPMYGMDQMLQEGWYAYKISSIDLFGRHSRHSDSGAWHQWQPIPNPRPWYYIGGPSDAAVHPYAVHLLDKSSPPPPTGVEAYALDPEDPALVRDSAYADWLASLPQWERGAVIGLRVKWIWTQSHMDQAPDTHEFRIYYQSGPVNALIGRTVSATDAGGCTLVVTDIGAAAAANAYKGAWLRIGSDSFEVTGSGAGTPLTLTVRRIGTSGEIAPKAWAACSVTLPEGHPLYVGYGAAEQWQSRYHVVNYDDTAYFRETIDASGRRMRQYELFLPGAGGESLQLHPDFTNPIVYARIGITAADDKKHTADSPKWNGTSWGDRFGNEGPVSAPATVYRVLRGRPARPVPPPDSEQVWATPADYHDKSFFTYRFRRADHLSAHLYRAMDDTLFRVDWRIRSMGGSLRGTLDSGYLDYFPPDWDAIKRGFVAAEVNAIASIEAYRSLSNDALRVLAALPGNEEAFSQLTVKPLETNDPAYADRAGPDNLANYAPDSGLCAYVDSLDGRSANRYFYRSAYVDGAQNRSELSLSSPPVWLPNVVPPRSPVLTSVLGGDREITLHWARNREEDLAEYRVYRTEREDAAEDIRLMSHVQTLPSSMADPVWTDKPVPGKKTFYYRLTAVDNAGNVSKPSPAYPARAYDDSIPVAPEPTAAWVDDGTGILQARIAWNSTDESLLERRQENALFWASLGGWRDPGLAEWIDVHADAANAYEYRLRAHGENGAVSIGRAVKLAAAR